jgi:hypothetical protein
MGGVGGWGLTAEDGKCPSFSLMEPTAHTQGNLYSPFHFV